MSIRESIQEEIKQATKARDHARLDTLRMAKGALLLKEKAKAKGATTTDAEVIETLRAEVRKRQQSLKIYQELDKPDEVEELVAEIAVIEAFLPQQLSEAALEKQVRAYLVEHPEMDHPGKLTGAMKKELGDAADGKVLNAVCRRVLE
ncbi:MAG: GatB/YqeY domain-containing protein [Candidatus Hydrogenedentes bacterium]|nr:GatB/YqeY domain-containing protein [Candidatus Hydrogenedentota bacterium]